MIAAKGLHTRFGPWTRVVGAGLVIAALFALTWLLTDEPIAIGVGYRTIDWALDPHRAWWLLLVVLVVRCLATAATVAGGGVGGLFIPLVVAGALLGRLAVARGGRRQHHAVRRHRCRRLPGRRVPRAAGRGHVRRRDHRPTRSSSSPVFSPRSPPRSVMGRASVTTYQRASTQAEPPTTARE